MSGLLNLVGLGSKKAPPPERKLTITAKKICDLAKTEPLARLFDLYARIETDIPSHDKEDRTKCYNAVIIALHAGIENAEAEGIEHLMDYYSSLS